MTAGRWRSPIGGGSTSGVRSSPSSIGFPIDDPFKTGLISQLRDASLVVSMKKRVEDLTSFEQEQLVKAVLAGFHSLATLDSNSLRVVKETSLVDLVSKRGFAREVVEEVICDICIVEQGIVVGLKG